MKKSSPPKMMPKAPKGYENSKFDKDKGVVEGGKADLKRDAKAIPKFMADKKKK